MSSENAIEIHNLNKSYGKRQVLHDLSFEVERGSIMGFLGPNGSGKSTTIKILCGLVAQNSGTAKILGMDIMDNMDEIRKNIGYMSQQFGLYLDLTVYQNLKFYAGLYGVTGQHFENRLKEIVELTKINTYLEAKAGHLSGGWKQRLALGCALLHEPPVVFLDEPTAGIDPVARRDLWDLLFDLSSRGITLFVTTHYMDEAERCHNVAYIFEGHLIALGTSDELRHLSAVNPEGTRRLQVGCKPLMKAYRYLHHVDAIKDVTVFGRDLHLLVDDTMSDEQLKALLEQEGFRIRKIRSVEPSLEDAFVALTQDAMKKRGIGI